MFLAPILVPDATPLQLAVGRYLAYGLLSALLLGRRTRTLIRALPARALGWLLLLGLLGNTLYYTMLAMAVRDAGPAATALVIGFLPVLVSLLGRNDHGAARLRHMLPSLLFCVAGAACIGQGVLLSGGREAGLGVICAIGALLSWTAFAVGNARALRRCPIVSSQDWNLLTGLATGLQALLLLPVAFWPPEAGLIGDWPRFLVVSAAVAFLASIGGNAFWNRMSRLLPLTLAGQMILFETVFALLYALVCDRRWPHPAELATLGCIVGAMLTALRAHRPVMR